MQCKINEEREKEWEKIKKKERDSEDNLLLSPANKQQQQHTNYYFIFKEKHNLKQIKKRKSWFGKIFLAPKRMKQFAMLAFFFFFFRPALIGRKKTK